MKRQPSIVIKIEFRRDMCSLGWKSAPGVAKWTKITVVKHITVGELSATIVGTPAQVADEFERWVKEADEDGVIELLLPWLRARGLFWDDYAVPGGTYRENLQKAKVKVESCQTTQRLNIDGEQQLDEER